MRPVLTHVPNDHLRHVVGPEAMEAAMTEEAFLQEKGEGKKMDRKRGATYIDLGVTTPTGTVMAVATTTRDEQVADPPCQDATLTKKERCSPGAGGERGE